MKIKIALLDDESLIVNAIANLLSRNEKLEIISKDTNPETFLTNIKNTDNKPDILLLDLNMKPKTGLQVIEELQLAEIDIKIIVLSSLYNSSMYGYMIKYGISCFLPKYTEPEELFAAIEHVYKYSYYDTKENKEILEEFKLLKGKNSNPWSMISLTDRETDILKLICEELSTKEIADKIYLSPKTIEAHRSKLMEKIGCKNVVGMVTYAILNGIYTLSNQKET